MRIHRLVILFIPAIVAVVQAADRPVAGSNSICTVHRERYVSHPTPGVAAAADVLYIGNGWRRREVHGTQARSDIAATRKVRYSDDNGRTWLPFEPMAASEDLKQNGVSLEQFPYALLYHAGSGRTVEMQYQRIYLVDVEKSISDGFKGRKNYYDHAFHRLSSDDGRTWTEFRQLIYEGGAPFNRTNWADPGYLRSNQVALMDTGISLADGRIAHPVTVPVRYEEDEVDKKVCAKLPWIDADKGFVPGVMVFFGTWNKKKQDYDWTNSQPVSVRRYVSTRGLEEPALAQLKDGTLLLNMRGSNRGLDPEKYPGRKWNSFSKDGGRTWSPVTDLRYDNGEQFYSPAAFARMIRSSKTGKLYWVGNINPTPSKVGGPRFPLHIAEMDETKMALKKDTVTVIDDRGPTDTAELQLNNFSLLENRETKDFEIFLTRYGERSDSIYSADVYKYTLTLTEKK